MNVFELPRRVALAAPRLLSAPSTVGPAHRVIAFLDELDPARESIRIGPVAVVGGIAQLAKPNRSRRGFFSRL